MVYAGLSALVGQSICLCPSICPSIIPYRLSVLYESVYTSPSINRVSVCISISSVCYTSFGHSLFFRIHFHCSVLRSVPLLRVLRNSHRHHRRPLYRHFRLILSFRVRADISSERAARACERVSIASERKEQKTHTTTYIRDVACERMTRVKRALRACERASIDSERASKNVNAYLRLSLSLSHTPWNKLTEFVVVPSHPIPDCTEYSTSPRYFAAT